METPEAFYRRLKPEGKRLILSIDGGGSKGLMTLHCLVKLEALTGHPCNEIFDFYAGTSTGSIIAAGLAKGMSAEKILGHYREFIPQVFDEQKQKVPFLIDAGIDAAAGVLSLAGLSPGPQVKKYAKLAARNDLKYMYRHQALKGIITRILEGEPNPEHLTTLGQLYRESAEAGNEKNTKRLLITIKDVRRSETLFAVNAGPGAKPFENMPLVDAVLASSVAPIFLEPFKVWVDGGVGSFGNPCYMATVEATEYFTGLLDEDYETKHDDQAYRHENVIHFSFGTGMHANNILGEKAVEDMHFNDWLLYVISEGQEDANKDQVRLTQKRFSQGNNWYSEEVHHKKVDFRRYELLLDPKKLEKDVAKGGLGMTLSDEERGLILGLEMNANSEEERVVMERVGEAWAKAIGKDFACPHSPYAQEPEAYTPRGSPPPIEPGLEEYLAQYYPPPKVGRA